MLSFMNFSEAQSNLVTISRMPFASVLIGLSKSFITIRPALPARARANLRYSDMNSFYPFFRFFATVDRFYKI